MKLKYEVVVQLPGLFTNDIRISMNSIKRYTDQTDTEVVRSLVDGADVCIVNTYASERRSIKRSRIAPFTTETVNAITRC
jgi:hypothetical protein